MKLEGVVSLGKGKGDLVIRRAHLPNGRFVCHFEAVESLDAFYDLCPEPTPRDVILPGGEHKPEYEGVGYKKKLIEHGRLRSHYLFLTSLVATEPVMLGWDNVDMSDPDTWGNYEQELKDMGLNWAEIARLTAKVFEVNSISESAFNEALEDFLLGRPDRRIVTLNVDGKADTQSSESANGSTSSSPATQSVGS